VTQKEKTKTSLGASQGIFSRSDFIGKLIWISLLRNSMELQQTSVKNHVGKRTNKQNCEEALAKTQHYI
jgi:hypothetical protein